MKRNDIALLLVLPVLIAASSGCGRPEDNAATDTAYVEPLIASPDAAQEPPAGADGTEPVSWISEITLGTETADDGSVLLSEDEFSPDEPIHLSITTGDAPAGAAVTIRVLSSDGAEMYVETRQVGDTGNPSFTLPGTGAWPLGDYRVQIRAEDVLVETRRIKLISRK